MEKVPQGLERNDSTFVFPNVEKELGEIERVAQKYSPQNPEAFVRAFVGEAKQAMLVDLSLEMWSSLGNTDSFDIPPDGWEKVAEHIEHTNQETETTRSWEDLRQKMQRGQMLRAYVVKLLSGVYCGFIP